jgi:hypothetical protein
MNGCRVRAIQKEALKQMKAHIARSMADLKEANTLSSDEAWAKIDRAFERNLAGQDRLP